MMFKKKILILNSTLLFLISINLVSACNTPQIYDANWFPISNGGFCPGGSCSFAFVVNGPNFANSPIIQYPIHIYNGDTSTEIITIQPSVSLANYVSPVTAVIPANTQKDLYLNVWVNGPTVAGGISVSEDCADHFSQTLSITTNIVGKNLGQDSQTLMQPLTFDFTGGSVTTSTTSTTTTTPSTLTKVTLMNSKGCMFNQLYCPPIYSACTYNFQFSFNKPTINCDSSASVSNPGVILSGSYLCPAYDGSSGFSSQVTCQLYGILNTASTTTTTSTTTSTSSTSTTSSTTTTTPVQSSTTTTTSLPTSSTIFDSFGCQFAQIVCSSTYQSCSYQFSGTIPVYSVSCDTLFSRPNPGTLKSGESLCPAYDNSKGYSRLIRCQLFANSASTSTTSTTTTSTSSTTTTTPIQSSTTTTTQANSGTVVLNQLSCSLTKIACPSSFAFCTYQLTNRIFPMSTVRCDTYILRQNPGTLNSGEPLCPPYDTNGFSNAVNCTVVGYGTASQQNIFTSLKNSFNGTLDKLVQVFLSLTVNVGQ